MKNVSLIRTLLVGLVFIFPVTLFAKATKEAHIPNDSQVSSGVLENGLTYYVRAHNKPEKRAELRLVLRAGSLQEEDDQRGLAHFTEHMLFNGTEKYPKNELVDVLESLGMQFGPDINAYTSFTETLYQLFVRTDQWDQFLLALEVLEQWASEASLTEEEFEKERGVVYEEYRSRQGAESRIRDQTFPVLFSGSRYAERLPIGSSDIILQAPVEALRRYYQDWYRPENFAVIAIGDFDQEEVVSLIRKQFSTLSSPHPARRIDSYPIPEHEETRIKIAHDPEATSTSVKIYTKYTSPHWEKTSAIKDELIGQLFHQMMSQRLDELLRIDSPPFLQGYAFKTLWSKEISLSGLVALTKEDDILIGLETLLTEKKRVERHGFTAGELERSKKSLLKNHENYWRDQDTQESSSMIQPLVNHFLKGIPYPSADWEWERISQLIPQITMKELRQFMQQKIGEKNRVILVTGPSLPPITDLKKEQIQAVLDRVASSSPEAWQDNFVDAPLVPVIPNSGSVVKRKKMEELGIEIWTLSNGATVVLKPTDFKEDEILFQAWSPGGSSLIDDAQYISSQLATEAVEQGGLGEFSADALQKKLAGKTLGIVPQIEEFSEGFTGSSNPEDLETLLQLLYLYYTAPRRDDVAWNSLTTRLYGSLKNREASPQNQYYDLFNEVLYSQHFRSQSLRSESIREANIDDAFTIFKDRFNHASDVTFFFVGAFELETLLPLVEQWIGALPEGPQDEQWVDRGKRYAQGVHQNSLSAGVEDLSIVSQIWTGEWDGSFSELYAIQSLAEALEMKLLRTIRENSSGTYSIGVYPRTQLIPVKEYRLVIQFTCAPERVDELIEKVKQEVEHFRSTPPESQYADDLVVLHNRSLMENLQRNSWWLRQIVFFVSTEMQSPFIVNRRALYQTLTAQLLMEASRQYFQDDRYIEVILYPESGP